MPIIKVDVDWVTDREHKPCHVSLIFPDGSTFDAPVGKNYPDSTVAVGLGYAILDRIQEKEVCPQPARSHPKTSHGVWRVGSHVGLNVYCGDKPICQCHSIEDAKEIVLSMNAIEAQRGIK